MIDFAPHLKDIIRQKEKELNKDIIRMHKRERVFPFSNNLESIKFPINQNNFNYPALDESYLNISKYYQLKPNELILTAGCDIALRTIYEALENIQCLYLPNSCYAMNFVYKRIYHPNTNLKNYEFDERGEVNVDKLILQISQNTGLQMLVIESPSGFTGQVLQETEFKKLLDYCEVHNITLVVDETYLETRNYTWTAKKYLSCNNLIVVSSFSKAHGIAGLRAGMIVSNSKNIKILNSLLPMHEITSFTNYLLNKVINDESLNLFKDQINEDENLLFEKLNEKKGFKFLRTNTNFVLFKNHDFPCNFIHDFLLDNRIKVKIHKSVRYFGEWCSASLGNKKNTHNLIKVLSKLN